MHVHMQYMHAQIEAMVISVWHCRDIPDCAEVRYITGNANDTVALPDQKMYEEIEFNSKNTLYFMCLQPTNIGYSIYAGMTIGIPITACSIDFPVWMNCVIFNNVYSGLVVISN